MAKEKAMGGKTKVWIAVESSPWKKEVLAGTSENDTVADKAVGLEGPRSPITPITKQGEGSEGSISGWTKPREKEEG